MLNRCTILFTSLWLAFNLTSCTEAPPDITNPLEQTPNVINTWRAESDDIAPLLWDSLEVVNVEFASDSSYMLEVLSDANNVYTYSGTFIAETGELSIFPITIYQSTPDSVVYQGIYEINAAAEPSELSLDVVEVYPDTLNTVPTVSNGFGSSNFGIDNIHRLIQQ